MSDKDMEPLLTLASIADVAERARRSRAAIEEVLEEVLEEYYGWRWSAGISHYVDALVALEEADE
jgi:hypothetical protein